MQTLEETRAFLRWRPLLLAGATMLTFFVFFFPLAAMIWGRVPLILGAGAVLIAACAWVLYFIFRRHYVR